MGTHREHLESQLAESRAAAERLAPLQRDQELAAQEGAILAEIKRQEEIARLEEAHAVYRDKAAALLEVAKPAVVEYRRRFDALMLVLEALMTDLPGVQAPIWAAAEEAKRAARIRRQIGELGGVPVAFDGGLDQMWDEIGGRDPQLAALPLLSRLPKQVRDLFRRGPHYRPERGAKNFSR
jgi:chaperonin cofactor prefoldin